MQMRQLIPGLVLLAGLILTAPAGAGPIEKMRVFFEQTRSARADFTQTVTDSSGEVAQNASGVVQFQRPGKFRWTYNKPYEQIIVGDGEKLWIYDKDLNQVTERKLDKALGSSPAALLAGSDEVDRYFALTPIGIKGRLDWLEAKPKDQESLFDKVHMGFNGNTLEVMELYDHFQQKTTIRLSKLQRNPRTPAGLYSFTIPEGADVVTE
jgi:outer membrane lipoprotein carrier protein